MSLPVIDVVSADVHPSNSAATRAFACTASLKSISAQSSSNSPGSSRRAFVIALAQSARCVAQLCLENSLVGRDSEFCHAHRTHGPGADEERTKRAI